jgi:hypothetical protein
MKKTIDDAERFRTDLRDQAGLAPFLAALTTWGLNCGEQNDDTKFKNKC